MKQAYESIIEVIYEIVEIMDNLEKKNITRYIFEALPK